MSIWVSWIFVGILFNCTYCFLFSKLSNAKNYFNIKSLLLCIFFAVIQGYTIYFKIGIRTLIILIDYILLLKLIFKKSITKTLIITFLIYILFAISEMIFVVISLSVFGLSRVFLTQTIPGIFLTNTLTLLIALGIFSFIGTRKVMRWIIKWYEDKQLWNLVSTIIICCCTLLFLLYRNLQGMNNLIDFLVNNIFVIGIIYFVISFLMEKTMNTKIKNEYNHLMNYAKTYEQEVVEKSKWQHEYENQLIIIRDKIDPENKKALRYINKLLKNKPSNENSQWLGKLTKFPDIGIKGLLHYKICQMIQSNIQVYVDVVDEDLISSKIPEKLLEENLQDISMALGVYLDNAMQAASESDNKYLIVEFKCTEEEIVFQISNTYKGNISIDNMSQDCFTTKGKNHGYGLSIVRDILAKNKYLSQEKEMNGMYYVQKLVFSFE